MDDITMIVNKIDELKDDNINAHNEIKDNIKCLPCSEHSVKLAKLETIILRTNGDNKKSKLDDIVTKRVMYIFGGIIAGIVLLLKELPNIINAIKTIGG